MADLLVVDDDPDAAEALAEALHFDGHQVRVAFNGEEGFRLMAERMPALLLLDVEMPVLDGPGMSLRMILHDAGMEKVPVLLISGITELHEVACRVGTQYFLSKPYRFEELLTRVERALRERAAPNPVRRVL